MTVPAHHVAVLVLPGVFPLELGIAAQIFGSEPRYRLTVCTPVPTRAVPTSGFTITATAGLDALSDADTVIVPGYQDADAGTVRRVERLVAAGDRDEALATFMRDIVGMPEPDLAAFRADPIWPSGFSVPGSPPTSWPRASSGSCVEVGPTGWSPGCEFAANRRLVTDSSPATR
jgi:hypothetical protein